MPGTGTQASLPAPAAQSLVTPEGVAVDVTLAATHNDGLPGCTDLAFTVANETGGDAGTPVDAPCVEGTVLAADLDAAAVTLPVLSTLGFPASGTLRVGSELIAYTATTETSFTGVIRGQAGSTAATHLEGASVLLAQTANATVAQNTSDVDASITLTGVSLGFPPAGVIQVESEFITYGAAAEVDTGADTVPDATLLTGAVRGAFGSVPSAHVAGRTAYGSAGVATSLTDAINAAQTAIPVASIGSLETEEGLVQIGSELVAYAAAASTVGECGAVAPPCLTGATRGAEGTAAASHSSAVAVFQFAQPDLDLATSTFTPGAEFFAVAAEASADVSDSETVIPVAASVSVGAAFPASGSLAIGDEIVAYTGVGSVDATCTPFAAPCFTGVARGQGGTAAAAHAAGAGVFQAFFSYTAAHDQVTALAVAGVEVTPVNDTPVAVDVAGALEPGTSLAVALEAADIDGDSGVALTGDCEIGFSVGTPPSHGSLGAIANDACTSDAPNTDLAPNTDSAAIVYTPETDYSGSDSFTVLVCDDAACDELNVALTVSDPTPTPSPSPTPTPEATASPTPTPEPTVSPTPEPQFAHGDIDCDGDVDATDALAILRTVAGLPVPPPSLAEGCPLGE